MLEEFPEEQQRRLRSTGIQDTQQVNEESRYEWSTLSQLEQEFLGVLINVTMFGL